jgi:two-component system chemotaxis sensor kinase CheA
MAIVRERVEGLKGTVRVQTQVGEGTTFILSVPTSLATFDGLVVIERGRFLVFPLSGVEAVTRVRLEDIGWVEGSTVLRFRGLVLPLARLGEVEGLPQSSGPQVGGPLTVVVLTAGGRKTAFLVDQVIGVQEVLARDLGPQLRRVRYVSSACMLSGQEAAPVLNVADLLTSMRGGLRALRAEPTMRAPQILAVDDSPTTRQLIRSTLEAAGYRVRTAANGMEAWHLVCSEPFALVVSDVSMPGLTGMDLLGRIRAHARLASIPVILVTGQENDQDRQMGLEMGANAYVLKSQFEEGALVELVEQLAPAGAAVRAS